MNTSIKNWRDNNKDKVKLQKKREKIKSVLRKYNILPQVGKSPNEEQTIILNQISNNDFSYYENFKNNKTKQTKTYKNRIHIQEERPIIKRARITYELRVIGILPKLGETLSKEQEEILNYVNENYETPIKSFIKKYDHLVPLEYRIWYRIKLGVQRNKKRKHGDIHFNLSVEDIIIPDECPYLNVPLEKNAMLSDSPFYISVDRIDSNKGYVKGNVQIISRLANTMKNNATPDQLITFAKNVLKLHNPQIQ